MFFINSGHQRFPTVSLWYITVLFLFSFKTGAKEVAGFGADKPIKRPAQPEEMAPAFVYFSELIQVMWQGSIDLAGRGNFGWIRGDHLHAAPPLASLPARISS